MIGETIGNFRIVSRLGSGGMGEVFLAEQTSIGTKVAIKVLRPEISQDKEHVQRFFNEARAVSRIKHAGIVKIFDVGFHSSGHAYLIMEYLEGESLGRRLARSGRLSLARLCEIGRQIASILDATHAAGITHRDLKPDNIFLVADAELAIRERVRILDFGIAKLTGTLGAGSPRTYGTMGTPAYMAPEQWGDSSKVDYRADIYALGCVAFEMACGRPPFLASNLAEACGKHLTETPPLARTLVEAVPAPLEKLLDDMLAKQPAERPQSLREVAQTFETIGETAPDDHDPLPPPVERTPSAFEHTMPSGEHDPQRTQATGVPRNAPGSTTLSSAASSTLLPTAGDERPRSQWWLAVAGGLVLAAGGTVAIVLASRDEPAQHAGAVAITDGGLADDARLAVRAWTAEKNPFVSFNDVPLQQHPVTRLEYAYYLSAMPPDEQPRFAPLLDQSEAPGYEQEAVTWVTWEQATAYCQAIGGRLPTEERWIKAAGGEPYISGGSEVSEWTATQNENKKAIVRGSYRGMGGDDLNKARTEGVEKDTEASAGQDPTPETVASSKLGFRCAK